jgi:RNA polymerase sigma factor (sigma-70 family)
MPPDTQENPLPGNVGQFTTTHWSVVLAAGNNDSAGSAQALERLCRAYWKPLYAYVRRQGHNEHEAQDLTQDFFARLLAKGYLSLADPARGRFRTFLLTSLQNFLRNEWKRTQREKRGGGQPIISLDATQAEAEYRLEPAHELSPDQLYERRWTVALLEQVLARLRLDYEANGSVPLFDQLKAFVWGDRNTASHAEIALQLGLSEGAVKVALHRLRRRFGQFLRAEIANTVNDPTEVEEELRYLMNIMSR